MFNTIQTVIMGGRYNLDRILQRIRYYHAAGDLTDAECDTLIQMARDNVMQTMGVDAKTEILALWDAVHELQHQVTALAAVSQDQGDEPGDEPTEPAEEIPEYVQPTGAHDAYNTGDLVTYNGQVYECQLNNCVWTPEAYPAGWRLVE